MRPLQIIWRNIFLAGLFLFSLAYTSSNFFPAQPALRIISLDTQKVLTVSEKERLQSNLTYLSQKYDTQSKIRATSKGILLTVPNIATQQLLHRQLITHFKNQYSILPILNVTTPSWLRYIGARTIQWGIDFKGGFVIPVQPDVNHLYQEKLREQLAAMMMHLRKVKIECLSGLCEEQSICLKLKDLTIREQAFQFLKKEYPTWIIQKENKQQEFVLNVQASDQMKIVLHQTISKKIKYILLKRLTGLGISDFTLRSSVNGMYIELPQVDTISSFQKFLTNNATLSFHTLQTTENINAIGTKTYTYREHKIPVDYTPILTTASVVEAIAGVNTMREPYLEIGLNTAAKKQVANRLQTEGNQLIAVVHKISYVNTAQKTHTVERLISVIPLRDMLQSSFQILGLSAQETIETAFLLGATLPSTTYVGEPKILRPRIAEHRVQRLQFLILGIAFLSTALLFIFYKRFAWITVITALCHLNLLIAGLSLFRIVVEFQGVLVILFIFFLNIQAQLSIYKRITMKLRSGQSLQNSLQESYNEAWYQKLLVYTVGFIVFYLIALVSMPGMVRNLGTTLLLGFLSLLLSIFGYHRALIHYFRIYLFDSISKEKELIVKS